MTPVIFKDVPGCADAYTLAGTCTPTAGIVLQPEGMTKGSLCAVCLAKLKRIGKTYRDCTDPAWTSGPDRELHPGMIRGRIRYERLPGNTPDWLQERSWI